MESRRLIKLGNNSHVISLPNEWLKKNKLDKGDLVYFKENGNNEVVLSPEIKEEKKELRELTIGVDNKDNSMLRRELVSAYVNDFNVIYLIGEDLHKKSAFIKKIINNHLMAIEIMEQTSNRIVTKDFLDIKYDSTFEIIKRVDVILRSMIFDLRTKPFKTMEEREGEINKWYFLMMRTERSLLTTHKCPAKKEVVSVLKHWEMARILEDISDRVKRLSLYTNKLNKKNKETIMGVWDKIEKYYLETMKAYYKQNINLAYKLSEFKKDYHKLCDKLMNKKVNQKEFYRSLELVRYIVKFIHAIGQNVYT